MIKEILSKIDESAGNLKGLPKTFIKELVSGYDNGLGGQGSTIELYKSKAKQKDLTSATKLTGGYVKPDYRGYHNRSPKEIEAEAKKKAYAGVAVKVDGEWAWMAEWQDYTEDGGNYRLMGNRGTVATVKRRRSSRSKWIDFDARVMKAGELSNFIDFSEGNVEIYLITADKERNKLRIERAALSAPVGVSKTKKAALMKFMKSKSSGMVDAIQEDLLKTLDVFNKEVNSMITKASKGEYNSTSDRSVDDLFKNMRTQYEQASTIAYHINSVVKDGSIFDGRGWGDSKNEKSYSYKKFIEIMDKLKEEL